MLDSGPPELPAQLTPQMWIPLCCWAAETCGVVAFMLLRPDREDGHMRPLTTHMLYTREDGRWVPPQAGIFAAGSPNGAAALRNQAGRIAVAVKGKRTGPL